MTNEPVSIATILQDVELPALAARRAEQLIAQPPSPDRREGLDECVEVLADYAERKELIVPR